MGSGKMQFDMEKSRQGRPGTWSMHGIVLKISIKIEKEV